MTSQRRAWNSTLPAPSKPLKRSRIKRKAPRRVARRAEDAPFVAFVRTLPCISCGVHGLTQAAHIKLRRGQVGIGHKVPDTQCAPLCWVCHEYWDGQMDGPANPFRGLSEFERFAIGLHWVTKTHAAWGQR